MVMKHIALAYQNGSHLKSAPFMEKRHLFYIHWTNYDYFQKQVCFAFSRQLTTVNTFFLQPVFMTQLLCLLK